MDISTLAGLARAEVSGPAAPRFWLVLTHGAGGGIDAPDLLAARDAAIRLGGAAALVLQPYRVRGARAPGNAPRQDAAWVEVVAALRAGRPGLPLIQGGRSNGARVACRTAAATGACGVLALAFPLHPPGRPGRSRAGELSSAGVPVLAIAGDRDPFGVPSPAQAGPAARIVVLAGQAHALSGGGQQIGAAVTGWLSALPGLAGAAGLAHPG